MAKPSHRPTSLMSALTASTHRVVWREGTLLCPQHLQQQQRQLESQSQLRASLTRPFAWGLGGLDIDEQELERGNFLIRSIVAILPDGTLLCIGKDQAKEQAEPLARALKEGLDPDTHEWEVGIHVPVGAHYDETSDSRYRTHSCELQDETDPSKSTPIELATPRVSFLVGQEAASRPNVLPIARVVKDQGTLRLDRSFIPPCLRVQDSVGLELRLRELLSRAGAERDKLLARRAKANPSKLRFEPRDLEAITWLGALSGSLACIQSMLQSRSTSPYTIYLELCRWAAELQNLSAKPFTPLAPAYLHHQAHASFLPLFERLHDLLEQIDQKSAHCLSLSRRSDGMWLGTFEGFEPNQGQSFVLAIKCGESQESAAQRIPALAKLASYSQIAGVIDAAVSGAKIEFIRRPPQEIPEHHDWLYFRILKNSRYWHEILREKSIAFYAGSPYADEGMAIKVYCIPAPATEPIPLTRIAS